MRVSKHRFTNCVVEVINEQAEHPEKPGEVMHFKTLVIANPDQAETYFFSMTDEVRRELIRKLTGGVQMATSLKGAG